MSYIKFILSIIIILLTSCYCILYLLRDLYDIIKNFQIRKYINKILPFFTKYNVIFLISSFTILFIFYLLSFNYSNIYILFVFTIFILNLLFLFTLRKKIFTTPYLRILSYILIVCVILIPFFSL